jgi:outer membrane lipoprotein-sorting protein
MIRRTFLALLATLPALPAMAAPVPLDRLSAYLNGITTAEARFTQFNDDGTRSAGTLYISRPGRMRFEYDPPNDALVLANAGEVAIFDARSNADPQQFPLGTTPLSLILGRNIDLGRANMVEKFYQTIDGSTVVVAHDPQRPESGKIELFFSPDPIALTQWIVTDQTGAVTAVRLGDLKTGMAFDNNFFSISRETILRRK